MYSFPINHIPNADVGGWAMGESEMYALLNLSVAHAAQAKAFAPLPHTVAFIGATTC